MDDKSEVMRHDTSSITIRFSIFEDTDGDNVYCWPTPDFMDESLFCDLLTEIVEIVTERDIHKFIELLDPSSSLWEELRKWNKKRHSWYADSDTNIFSRVRDRCLKESRIKGLIDFKPSQEDSDIRSIDVEITNETDPFGELRAKINQLEASKESEADEEVVGLDTDLDTDLTDEEPGTDEEVQENPEKPCYYPSQIEMGTILKNRIKKIMSHYHKISNLKEAFDDVDFVVFTARFRMLNDQTEKRISHPDAGVLPPEELESRDKHHRKKRMFMYVHSTETEKSFEELKKDVQERDRTLFIIIADECHWGITKDNKGKLSAHNQFINEWCKHECPKNVLVVQISATPFNLLTRNSRLPEVRCRLGEENNATILKEHEEGDLVVVSEDDCVINSKEVELHVVHWSEVELKNFERGMLMKLKSSLNIKGLSHWYLKVSSDGTLGVTPNEDNATIFIVQGRNGIVTLKVLAAKEQQHSKPLTVSADAENKLEARSEPQPPTQFEVRLDFGVGVIALRLCEKPDLYISVNEHEQVSLEAAKVERKWGVSIMKPKAKVAEVSFEFYTDQCKQVEDDVAGHQYMSLNYYLSTINCSEKKDQKIRQDEIFQGIVKKAEKSKMDTSALLFAEYCYHILHLSVYDSDEKIRLTLTCAEKESSAENKSPAAEFERKVNRFLSNLKEYQSEDVENSERYIKPEAFELVREQLSNEAESDFLNNLKEFSKLEKQSSSTEKREKSKETLVTSFILCLMHLSPKKLQQIEKENHSQGIEGIKKKLKENKCQALIENWKDIAEDSETFCLVRSLVVSGKSKMGKMKIVRAKDRKSAQQFYYTLRLAREVSSFGKCFEVIRDYGGIQIEKELKFSNPFFNKLQPDCCMNMRCDCTKRIPKPNSKHCAKCEHVHKAITQYEDLENLACVLILVEKGRMGDTFPQSFDCLDLRLSYHSSREYLTTLIQELGRLCRYVSIVQNPVGDTPYVLVGNDLFDKLKKSLEQHPSMSAVDCHNVDRYMKKDSQSKETTCSSLRWLKYEAQKESFDYQNQTKHPNRILLQAEPQIGKTGAYLCLIKNLREEILGKETVSRTITATFHEDAFYCYNEFDSSEDVVRHNEGTQDWQYPYWKNIDNSPSLLVKPVLPGKYSIGGCFYTHDTEEFPYLLLKPEQPCPAKTPRHLFSVAGKRDDMRAWHWFHFKKCGQCQQHLKDKELVEDTMEVNIDGSEIRVHYSLPGKHPSYVHVEEQLKSLKTTERAISELDSAAAVSKSSADLAYWIFHPSHRDDPRKSTLNYHHVMQKNNQVEHYVQIVVVRREKFQEYKSLWGKMLAILQLPDALPSCEKGASAGGVGYARRFIQKVAHFLKLEYVFVIDDNVALMSEAEFSTDGVDVLRDGDGVMKMKPCSFLEPLLRLQRIAQGKDATSHTVRDYEPCDFIEDRVAQQFPMYSYTGPAKLFGDQRHKSYGVLGLMRSVPKARKPFLKNHVYAFILLNVKSTVEKGVFYRPWPCWEDLRFNDDCDKAGLWVVKCNRYHFLKVQYRDWINNLVPLSIFKWKDDTSLVKKKQDGSELPENFEEGILLKHLRNLVESQDPENCFKGRIGNYVQDDGKDATSPERIVDKIKARDLTKGDIDNGVPIVILSYFLNLDRENLNRLDLTFCSTKEKIVFVTSAKEVVEERPDISVTTTKKLICHNREMRERNAQFDLFSAADPCKHRVRYILIEASFPPADEEGREERNINKTENTTIENQSSSLGFLQHKSRESKLRFKRSLQEPPMESVSSKCQKVEDDFSYQFSSINTFSPTEDLQGDISAENDNILVEVNNHEISQGENELLEQSKVKRMKIDSVEEKLSQRHGDCDINGNKDRCTTSKPLEKEAVSELQDGQINSVEKEHQSSKESDELMPSNSIEMDNAFIGEAGEERGAEVDDDRTANSVRRKSRPGNPRLLSSHQEKTNDVTAAIVDLWREFKERGTDIAEQEVRERLDDFTDEDLKTTDERGHTALLKACSLPSMSPHVMKYLITTRKVDLNCTLPDDFDREHPTAEELIPGMSALSVAIRKSNVKGFPTKKKRPGNSVDVYSVDIDGNTALHHCVNSVSICSFRAIFSLFKRKWMKMRNNEGKNPLDICNELEEKLKEDSKNAKKRSLANLAEMRKEMEGDSP